MSKYEIYHNKKEFQVRLSLSKKVIASFSTKSEANFHAKLFRARDRGYTSSFYYQRKVNVNPYKDNNLHSAWIKGWNKGRIDKANGLSAQYFK